MRYGMPFRYSLLPVCSGNAFAASVRWLAPSWQTTSDLRAATNYRLMREYSMRFPMVHRYRG